MFIRCFYTFLLMFFILNNHQIIAKKSCRCLPSNPICWPNNTLWRTFNQSINGRLIAPLPSATPCTSMPINENACNNTIMQWTNPFWRSDQVGAMQNYNWENSSCSIYNRSIPCQQGSVPILAVNATLPEHVVATIKFVKDYNLRLVIKTTGHDYLGRSTANSSLLLWLHYMKNMTLINEFTSCGVSMSNVARLSAGAQWGEVYTWLNKYNLTAVGGASATVGSVGGFLQGGGHGPLSRWKGLGADNVVEFDVVTADGQRQTVSACQNTDLFWALRGGGGGTFAVVLNVILRTYPSPSVIAAIYSISPPNDTRYNTFIHDFILFLPTLADVHWSGYFYFFETSISIAMILPNGNLSVAYSTLTKFLQNNTDLPTNLAMTVSLPSFYDFFNYVLAPSNPTGANVLLGSRLIPETIVRSQPEIVAQAFIDLRAHRKNNASLLGHLVAGEQVSKMNTSINSVNPVWRTSLIHMAYSIGWPDLTSETEKAAIAEHVRSQVAILQRIAGGNQSGCYMNEADPNEPNWQQKFFGTQANYDRLKSIKNSVDPQGIFICKNCVGSDDWSSDLNCPLISMASKFYTTTFLFMLTIFILF